MKDLLYTSALGQEDLCQSVANARRALLACGGKICLDGGMGQVGGDEHPALKIPGKLGGVIRWRGC